MSVSNDPVEFARNLPTHNHTQRGIRPSGQCPACDQYTSIGVWLPVPTCLTAAGANSTPTPLNEYTEEEVHESEADMTITEFLKARIAEDERAARDATEGPWEVKPTKGGDQPWITEVGSDYWLARTSSDPGSARDANAQHIARHDPSRVLAECAAKRAILEQRKGSDSSMNDDEWTMGYSDANYDALYAIASVYAGHPDFQQEWER